MGVCWVCNSAMEEICSDYLWLHMYVAGCVLLWPLLLQFDVQALVRTCVENGLEFNIRTDGHNAVGRTLVDDSLLIDMRDISGVTISEDKKTAKIGGGILVRGLLKALREHGLVTPLFVQSSALKILLSVQDLLD